MKNALLRLLGRESTSREELVYSRLHKRSFQPGSIIDVGAYKGEWSKLARNIFGPVPTLMVEAQEEHAGILQNVSAQDDNWTFAIALCASAENMEKRFFKMGTGSSMMSELSDIDREEKILKTTTLDRLTKNLQMQNTFLKIDVQGAELEVLRGAKSTLAQSSLVQLETAILSYNEGAPTMREILQYMEKEGFAPVDIASEIRIDTCLIQIDLLFAPMHSALRPSFFDWKARGI